MKRILLVSNDYVGRNMAGPAIRYYHFAKELAKRFDVTLVIPNETDVEIEGVALIEAPRFSHALFKKLSRNFDVVITQQLNLRTMKHLARTRIRAIYDLYDPFMIENLPLYAARQTDRKQQEIEYRLVNTIQEAALATGDAFVCASERQRDLWLGALGAAGRLDSDRYNDDASLRNLIEVVPSGVEEAAPAAGPRVMKGVIPGIGEDDKVLLWAGGIWNWLDPLTVIRAVAAIVARRDDVKLYFLGVKDPNPQREESAMTRRAIELARELGVHDRAVFFHSGWTAYGERRRYLEEADVGVSAHFDNVETRFAFRTRLLDHFSAGLPTVTTKGDVLADVVAARGLGRTVEFEDVDGWVRALTELLDDEREYRAAQARVMEVRDELSWPNAVRPLADMAAVPGAPVAAQRAGMLILRYQWLRLRLALMRRGAAGSIARLGHLLAARARDPFRAVPSSKRS